MAAFFEGAQLFYFRHLFFDPIPYVSPRATDLSFALALWLAVIACLIVGLFTRPAAIANYAFTDGEFTLDVAGIDE